MASLDDLISEWLTLPDLAQALGIEVGKVRQLVRDRSLVGVRRGERGTFQVPAGFLIPAGEPGAATVGSALPDVGSPEAAAEFAVLPSARGTAILLADAGFSDEEILEWFFAPCAELGGVPIDELRAGHRARVRQVAQALA